MLGCLGVFHQMCGTPVPKMELGAYNRSAGMRVPSDLRGFTQKRRKENNEVRDAPDAIRQRSSITIRRSLAKFGEVR
jgi:hypothetical protein